VDEFFHCCYLSFCWGFLSPSFCIYYITGASVCQEVFWDFFIVILHKVLREFFIVFVHFAQTAAAPLACGSA
jgi:hypothetical protein